MLTDANKKTGEITLNLFHSILLSICTMLPNLYMFKHLDLYAHTYNIYCLFTQACIFFNTKAHCHSHTWTQDTPDYTIEPTRVPTRPKQTRNPKILNQTHRKYPF